MVLLGDVLELRHGPPREALAVARPFFEDLGRALAGRELVVVAGNHDHALIEPWLALRAPNSPAPEPLGLEQLLEPAEASPMVERFAEWASPARVRVAYPGLWVRPDVYATHGHYLDCHLTVPTLERLSVGAMSRLLGRPAHEFEQVDDYEAVTAPMYAWRHAVARDARTGNALNGIATVHAWRALGGGGGSDGAARGGNGARARALAAASVASGCARARSCTASHWPSPRSTAPGSGRCARRSPPESCAAPGCARWARWRRAWGSATPTWSSATPTAPGRCPATTRASGTGRRGARRHTRRQARQHRLLDLRLDLPHRHARREPLLAGHVRARRGLRPAAARSGCCSIARVPSSSRRGTQAKPCVKQGSRAVRPARA